eukprot:761082-Hanusia_phi.AAC.12
MSNLQTFCGRRVGERSSGLDAMHDRRDEGNGSFATLEAQQRRAAPRHHTALLNRRETRPRHVCGGDATLHQAKRILNGENVAASQDSDVWACGKILYEMVTACSLVHTYKC